jgi:hypothetical protein
MSNVADDNYWGTTDFLRDIARLDESAPIALLRRQADKLTEITRGQVDGSVDISARGGTITASLYAGVPEHGEYKFKILSVA